MCNNLKMADCRVKWMKIWQLHFPRNCICRVLFMSNCLSSVWGHLVHFAKFPMLRFQKATAPTVFTQFQPNFIVNMLVMRQYGLLLFFSWNDKNSKFYGTLEICVNTGPYGLEISKHYSYSFIWSEQKLYDK